MEPRISTAEGFRQLTAAMEKAREDFRRALPELNRKMATWSHCLERPAASARESMRQR